MTDIDDPKYVAECREETAGALRAEGITEGKIDQMDPDEVLDVIAEALIKHDIPERHVDN